jgi:ammonia channel protein AmtB
LALILLFWIAGLLLVAALARSLQSAVLVFAALCVAVLAAIPALWQWKNSATGLLQWDGEAWSWAGELLVGRVTVVLDLQRLMLIRVKPIDGAPRSLWLESPTSPIAWSALRRALVDTHVPE